MTRQNPEGWKTAYKQGWCEICKREPIETFETVERRGWPTLCAECVPKWERHVERTAAGNELWTKYLQFRREAGRETYFDDLARAGRAKADFLEKFESGGPYVLKRSFEEWLKQQGPDIRRNPLLNEEVVSCDGVGCQDEVSVQAFACSRWKRRTIDGEVFFLCPKCYDEYIENLIMRRAVREEELRGQQ